MANKQYQKGVRLEREIVNLFKEAGWDAVRTAGSHGKVDVIVWKYSKPQLGTASHVLQKNKFDYYDGCFTRQTKKYQDKLYSMFILGASIDGDLALLLQCKRKAVKHG